MSILYPALWIKKTYWIISLLYDPLTKMIEKFKRTSWAQKMKVRPSSEIHSVSTVWLLYDWEHKWRPSSPRFYLGRKTIHKYSGNLSSKWKVIWHLHELKEVNTCLPGQLVCIGWSFSIVRQYKQRMNKVKARLWLNPKHTQWLVE
jgi:hypothetical protein